MESLTGPYHTALFLLLGAGAAKLWQPSSATAALATLRLPAWRTVAAALGLAELALALAALLSASRLAVISVAVAYAGFAAFVAFAMRRPGTASSCGCFGQAATPPGAVHLGVNLAAAAVAGLAASTGVPDGLPAMLRHDPVQAAAVAGVAALCAWLAATAMTLLPQLPEAAKSTGKAGRKAAAKPAFLPDPVLLDGDR